MCLICHDILDMSLLNNNKKKIQVFMVKKNSYATYFISSSIIVYLFMITTHKLVLLRGFSFMFICTFVFVKCPFYIYQLNIINIIILFYRLS